MPHVVSLNHASKRFKKKINIQQYWMNVGVIIYCFVQKGHLACKQNVYVCRLRVLGLSTKIYVAGGGDSVVQVHAVVSIYSLWNFEGAQGEV